MARSISGRVVLEVTPELKRRLHSRLAAEGRTLKEWFLEQAHAYLSRSWPVQLSLGISPTGSPGAREARMRLFEEPLPQGAPLRGETRIGTEEHTAELP